MHNRSSSWSIKRTIASTALAAAGVLTASLALAAMSPDFTDPAVTMSGEAVIASGTCIAKYAAKLDDPSRPAAEIGQHIAKRCAKQISRSAGLASWMAGKPEDFAKNLKYAREDLTTNAVLRYRAGSKHQPAG